MARSRAVGSLCAFSGRLLPESTAFSMAEGPSARNSPFGAQADAPDSTPPPSGLSFRVCRCVCVRSRRPPRWHAAAGSRSRCSPVIGRCTTSPITPDRGRAHTAHRRQPRGAFIPRRPRLLPDASNLSDLSCAQFQRSKCFSRRPAMAKITSTTIMMRKISANISAAFVGRLRKRQEIAEASARTHELPDAGTGEGEAGRDLELAEHPGRY